MRHRTGLRNRFRTGKSTYAKKHKGRIADRYGTWSNGRQTAPEVILGLTRTWTRKEDKET